MGLPGISEKSYLCFFFSRVGGVTLLNRGPLETGF